MAHIHGYEHLIHGCNVYRWMNYPTSGDLHLSMGGIPINGVPDPSVTV